MSFKNNCERFISAFFVKKSRLIIGIVCSMAIIAMGIFAKASFLSIMVLVTALVIASLVNVKLPRKLVELTNCLFAVLSAVATVFLSQLIMNEWALSVGVFKVLLAVICVLIVILFFYTIIQNVKISVLCGTAVPMLLTTINYYVYAFRGNEFAPHDFFATQTAVNVFKQYDLFIAPNVFYAWSAYALMIITSFCFDNFCNYRGVVRRVVSLVSAVLLVFAFFVLTGNMKSMGFMNVGTVNNTFILNFSIQLGKTFVSKPDGYSAEAIKSLEERYSLENSEQTDETPHIIVIMNESFADLRVLGEKFKTNKEVTPFFDSLDENVVKGFALSSIFGGKTPNSEYEFLTGNTMAFLPEGSIAYQQYVKEDSYSIVKHLSSLGYSCTATHPFYASGWMRDTVWYKMGFDSISFVEAYSGDETIREYISDKAMYQKIIEDFENRASDSKQFVFGVTMQNHGSYDYAGGDFDRTISLEGYSNQYPDVEQYLSVVNESDQALEYLISYFEAVDEPVVIMMYGDHFPQLDPVFYSDTLGSSYDTLEEQMLQYKVPFVIWSNFDIEEKTVECTGLNYLSSYLFDVADMQQPVYNEFLQEIQKIIPAINPYGIYSAQRECWIQREEASDAESEALGLYEQLQYNCMFDKKNRSEKFFPR